MAWTPANTVINARAVAENLLTYIEANQVEALAWAHGAAGLKPLARFENTAADPNNPVYPAIQFVSDNEAMDYGGEYPRGAYSLTFEVLVVNATPGTALLNARSYDRAVKSMVRNCPNATWAANTGARSHGSWLETVESGFDPIQKHETQMMFLQQFQIRATYFLEGAAQ